MLLMSKMYKTVKAIVTNLISSLDAQGHVLNGAKAYYTNRSQPSLLSTIVYEIYNQTGDVEFGNHSLNQYYAMWNKPRPEASTVDREFSSKFLHVFQKQPFY